MNSLSRRVRVSITRQGVQALFIGMFCLLGAVIRDLNLLVILGAMVFATLWIQWRLGRRNLRGLAIRQILPEEAFVGDSFSVSIIAENRNPRLHAFQLSVWEPIQLPGTGSDSSAQGSCVLQAVDPGGNALGEFACISERRGRYQFGPIRAESAYPFGLTRAYFDEPQSTLPFVVFPRLLHLRPGWRRKMQRQHSGGNRAGQRAGSHEGQFFGLRAWQNGDSRRWIHWRTTARIGEIAVRQFEHPRDEQMLVIVDLHRGPGDTDVAVERSVSLAATILDSVTRSTMFQLAFAVSGSEEHMTAGTSASLVRREGLTILAEAQGSKEPRLDQLISSLGIYAAKRWPLIVISTRPRSGRVWPETAQRWLEQRGGMWVNVMDASTEDWVDWRPLDATR